jgi:hypothetical protein
MSDQFARAATMDGVRGRGENLFLGILAGVVAAIVGALIWMGITVATGYEVGYVAIGIGALVGMAIRFAGNGTSIIYGIMGALLTFLSCLTGETLAELQSLTSPQVSFMDVLSHSDLSALVTHIVTSASPITYIIYGIGIFEGFKLSVRKI